MKTSEYGGHRIKDAKYEIERDVDCRGYIIVIAYPDGTREELFIPDEFMVQLKEVAEGK
jgi:hypothetical protein